MARLEKDSNAIATNLDERLNKIANEYAGIWSVGRDELDDLEKMIEIISQEEDLFDDLIAKTKYDSIECMSNSKKKTNKLQIILNLNVEPPIWMRSKS